jgi:hypothetical protein
MLDKVCRRMTPEEFYAWQESMDETFVPTLARADRGRRDLNGRWPAGPGLPQ